MCFRQSTKMILTLKKDHNSKNDLQEDKQRYSCGALDDKIVITMYMCKMCFQNAELLPFRLH